MASLDAGLVDREVVRSTRSTRSTRSAVSRDTLDGRKGGIRVAAPCGKCARTHESSGVRFPPPPSFIALISQVLPLGGGLPTAEHVPVSFQVGCARRSRGAVRAGSGRNVNGFVRRRALERFVELLDGSCFVGWREVAVSERHFRRPVAEELLQHRDADAGHCEVTREAVSEVVPPKILDHGPLARASIVNARLRPLSKALPVP